MNAIPTKYNGTRFRSRLEARWAAFFDNMEWPWEYEPVDLNGYIPDFILNFHKPLLVEVKPEFGFNGLESHTPKTMQSGWGHDAAIVGAGLIDNTFPSIGILSQRHEETADWHWALADLGKCGACNRITVYHDEGGFYCSICGEHIYSGNGGDCVDLDDIKAAWREAGNQVQWRGQNYAKNESQPIHHMPYGFVAPNSPEAKALFDKLKADCGGMQ